MTAVNFLPRPAPEALSTLHNTHLNTLQEQSGRRSQHPSRYEKDVAHQFEALMIQQMLKQVRQSSMGSLLDSDQTRMAQSMHDEEMAMQLSRPGMGLAEALLDQIRGGAAMPEDVDTEIEDDAGATLLSALANLPNMRNQLGELHFGDAVDPDDVEASSISELIDLLAAPAHAIDRVSGAVRKAPEHIHRFVDRMADAARHAATESGLPEKLILGQAALESGWGKREILHEDGSTSHNLFGIKATGNWQGDVVNIMTTEFQDGVPRKVQQPFRAYDSYDESFADYARLLTRNDRYSKVLAAASAEEAAERIQDAGYATDPGYADKLISIMSYFDGGKR